MPRTSKSQALISTTGLASLKLIGANLRRARQLRGWTLALAGEKAGMAESSMKNIENGSPSVAVGLYVAMLCLYGFEEQLMQIGDPEKDVIGKSLEPTRSRVRAKGKAVERSRFEDI
jgi:transcriptional regulator with XRE-family HTH domain